MARWRPTASFPIIEQFGLMNEFTLSMLRRGCRAAKAWPADISISINLTSNEVCDPATPLALLGVAMECGFPATRLEVEITEKALVKDLTAAKQVIAALRSAGVKILLDDFGAGYSGLGYANERESQSVIGKEPCCSGRCTVGLEVQLAAFISFA